MRSVQGRLEPAVTPPASPPAAPPDGGSSYLSVLIAAAEECVEACGGLMRISPQLSLSSVFSQDVHALLYLVSNVETTLHQFVDRELLQEPWVRRREQGGRLQDALSRATVGLKSTVQQSLLAGGIASLLHLFALTLRRINAQLEALLEHERRGDAHLEIACAAVSAALRHRCAARRPRLRALLGALGAGCAARVLALRWRRRRAADALHASQERLGVLLQMWWLATSVLQRAHRANSASYIELGETSPQRDRQRSERQRSGRPRPCHCLSGRVSGRLSNTSPTPL